MECLSKEIIPLNQRKDKMEADANASKAVGQTRSSDWETRLEWTTLSISLIGQPFFPASIAENQKQISKHYFVKVQMGNAA